MLQKCKIIDTTLREGEQTPGIHFSIDEKTRIIDMLAELGVHEVELGISSPSLTCLSPLISHCTTKWPHLLTSLWCRCNTSEIIYCAKLGPDVISLSIPASDLLITEKMGKDRSWVVKTIKDSIHLAREAGIERVAVGFEDSIRADHNFLAELAAEAEQAGAFRVRLADTVGTATPGLIRSLLHNVLKTLTLCEIGIHTHNDFGMATANAIAAYESGATWADATILGLGERCGCARLEEIAGYLHLMGEHPGFRIDKLKPLSEYVARLSDLTIPRNRPLLGDAIFTCETGLHLHGLLLNPATYEPYSPEQTGAKRELLFGTKVGRRALIQQLRSLFPEIDTQTVEPYLQTIHFKSRELSRPLTILELEEALRQNIC